MTTKPRLIVLSERDNICILASPVSAGETVHIGGVDVVLSRSLGMGHKLARQPIAAGTDVIKYGFPIGFAATDIPLGEHVHVHNLTSRYTVVEIME